MAIEHNAIADGERHEPKGIASASSGDVYAADGAGSGAWGSVPSPTQTEVIVRSVDDLPSPVANAITLSANTVYILDGAINIGVNRIILGSKTTIRGFGANYSSITSTTTGNMFTAVDTFELDEFAVTATSSTLFACTGGSFESAYLRNVTINSCGNFGTITNWYSWFWQNGAVVSSSGPLTTVGTCNIFILDLVEWITGYSTAVDLGSATFNTCSFFRCGFQYASATQHVNIAANSANINTGKVGRFNFNNFANGGPTAVNNLTVADIQWDIFDNINQEDSTHNAQAYMHTQTTTTISGGDGDSGNPKLVNGATNWVTYHDDQFTVTTGGRFTYDGINDIEVKVTCGIVGTAASSTHTYAHYIAKNGTAITASKTLREYASTATGSPTPCAVVETLSSGDYLELYVENTTGTVDWVSDLLNITVVGIK